MKCRDIANTWLNFFGENLDIGKKQGQNKSRFKGFSLNSAIVSVVSQHCLRSVLLTLAKSKGKTENVQPERAR